METTSKVMKNVNKKRESGKQFDSDGGLAEFGNVLLFCDELNIFGFRHLKILVSVF